MYIKIKPVQKSWWEMAQEYTPGYDSLGTAAGAGLLYSGGLKKMYEAAKNAGLSDAAFNTFLATKDFAGRSLGAFGGATKEGLSALTYTDYLRNSGIGDTSFGTGVAGAGIAGLSYYLYNNPGAVEYLKRLFKSDCTKECTEVCKKSEAPSK